MNKKLDSKNEEISLKDNKDVVAVLKGMQHRLDSMEEKIDSLIQQSKQKTFNDKRFSRQNKEYDRPSRPRERKYGEKKEEVSSEGKFYHGRPFGKKKDGGKSNLGKNKKPYNKSSKRAHGKS